METETTIPLNLSEYPRYSEQIPPVEPQQGDYEILYARTSQELDEIFQLRYRVFNLEMKEGLDEAHRYQRDFDAYDACCHHVYVKHKPSNKIIGTYRFQTRKMAGQLGFYGNTEFALSDLPEAVLDQSVEVGRACIDEGHRNGRVLIMLWRGVIQYVSHNSCRYLFGCCSINSQDPIEGETLYRWLDKHGYVHPDYSLHPQAGFECIPPADSKIPKQASLPTLMRLYLQNDLKVVGRPAIDREFKTIDYFVLLDMEQISDRTRKVFFPQSV